MRYLLLLLLLAAAPVSAQETEVQCVHWKYFHPDDSCDVTVTYKHQMTSSKDGIMLGRVFFSTPISTPGIYYAEGLFEPYEYFSVVRGPDINILDRLMIGGKEKK